MRARIAPHLVLSTACMAYMAQVGAQRAFDAEGFAPRDHVVLGEGLGILDFETASEVCQ